MIPLPDFSGIVNGLNGIYSFLLSIPQYLMGAIGDVADIFTYPIIAIISLVLAIMGDFVTNVLAPANAIYSLDASMWAVATNLLSSLFPMAWISLMGLGFVLIGLVRLYHFLKDVEIAGFKI